MIQLWLHKTALKLMSSTGQLKNASHSRQAANQLLFCCVALQFQLLARLIARFRALNNGNSLHIPRHRQSHNDCRAGVCMMTNKHFFQEIYDA